MADHRDEARDKAPDGWAGEVMADADENERQRLSEARTAMAEDRTVLANERTFASWLRTGLTCVAIGLGFHALFTSLQPWWLPRAIATTFFLVAIFVTLSAERRACAVVERLHAHRVRTVGAARLRSISWVLSLAIATLVVAQWVIPIGD